MHDTAAQSLALALGVSALVTVACRRVRIPALLPLLLVGLCLGVSGFKVIDADSLGSTLKGFITVAIGLLIFEGGLHLNRSEFARAPRAVWGLLTVGAVVTWAGAAAAAHYILLLSWPISALLGSALIVTGPTVVQPLLRLLRVSPRVHTALAAEAVLIDPIGVIATITTLELLRLYYAAGLDLKAASLGLGTFARPMIGGAGVGVIFGMLGFGLLKLSGRAGRIDPQLLNLLAVGICMTCVGVGEAVTPEGGLVAVTICGIMMARAHVLGATELRAFKELLAVMLVGTLFTLLSSRFNVGRLANLSWREPAFVGALILGVRPLSVFFATLTSRLSITERIFAGTFAPRGIVALSVITVAAAELSGPISGQPASVDPSAPGLHASEVAELEVIMFVVIAGTVLLASTLSPLLAWLLRLRAGVGNGVMLIGGHPLSAELAKWFERQKIECRIIDINAGRASAAAERGIDAIVGDATDSRWMDDVGAMHNAGWLLAWTGNPVVDQIAVRWARDRLGKGKAALWSSKPAREPYESADIGRDQPLSQCLDDFGDGRVRLAEADSPSSLHRVLGWVKDGRFSLFSMEAHEVVEGCTFVGIALAGHTEEPPKVAAESV
ncbi:MAG: cation:proton antiporter [Phycisphaerales bacterium]